ncbi:MAG: FecR domain-containing protein [Bacteroidia bacterium]|nr:FecR domain-containing protein [Bacteroidia bacterium]
MEKQISKYLNGTANPNEFSEVLAALCAEDNNGKVSAELLKHWKEILTAAIESKENSRLLDKIHHRIALEESRSVARKFTIYKNLLKVAAVLIIGLIVTTSLFFIQPKTDLYAEITQTVTTPYGARTNFKLPDGSEVWLNSGSTISFPRQYGAVRDVELTGQAYFHVVKDGKPFFVKTGYGSVEVMGTSFDVKAYDNDNFETTLVEGSVKVSDKTNRLAILKPGQRSIISTNNEFSLNEVNTDLITSWREGKLIFVKEPFSKVAKELERWYNVKIELQGERLKKLGYTGTIEMESFGEVLDLINVTTPIKSSFDKSTRILKISGR